jgi:hypothetical protein
MGDEGGHIGTVDDIEELASKHADKPKHTVIDRRYLKSAFQQLAIKTLNKHPTIHLFNKEQENREQKGPINFRGSPFVKASITANGWEVSSGKVHPVKLRSITIEQLRITTYLLPERSFQFTVSLLHWTPRA